MKLAIEIVSILNEWMNAGHQFTCFDVTRELTNRGFNPVHQDTLDFVHGLSKADLPPFMGTAYGRFTTSFTTSSGYRDTAEVYRLHTDVSKYDPDRNNLAKVKSKKKQKSCGLCGVNHKNPVKGKSIAMSVSSVNTTPKKSYTLDKRGRICVRKEHVDKLKVQPGDRVFLHKKGTTLVLSNSSKLQGAAYLGNMKVDTNGNIRIGRKKQAKAGLTGPLAMASTKGLVVLS